MKRFASRFEKMTVAELKTEIKQLSNEVIMRVIDFDTSKAPAFAKALKELEASSRGIDITKREEKEKFESKKLKTILASPSKLRKNQLISYAKQLQRVIKNDIFTEKGLEKINEAHEKAWKTFSKNPLHAGWTRDEWEAIGDTMDELRDDILRFIPSETFVNIMNEVNGINKNDDDTEISSQNLIDIARDVYKEGKGKYNSRQLADGIRDRIRKFGQPNNEDGENKEEDENEEDE